MWNHSKLKVLHLIFSIGALTDMPAVKLFALYAGVALLINFFLQMTCFLSLFTLDTHRQEVSVDMQIILILMLLSSKSKVLRVLNLHYLIFTLFFRRTID